MSDFADWTTVVIKGSPSSQGKKAQPSLKLSPTALHLRKLDSDETPKPKVLDPASRHEIVTRRVANKWDQAELNRQCAFPPNTIRDIESGRYSPSMGQLQTLNRVLKCGLKYA